MVEKSTITEANSAISAIALAAGVPASLSSVKLSKTLAALQHAVNIGMVPSPTSNDRGVNRSQRHAS
jgi:hypothetical protein